MTITMYFLIANTLVCIFLIAWLVRFYIYTAITAERLVAKMNSLAKGEIQPVKQETIKMKRLRKLLPAITELQESMAHKVEMTQKIEKGENITNTEKISESDILGNQLLSLYETLSNARVEEQKLKEEEQKQVWATRGEAIISETLRMGGASLDEMSFHLIKKLADYTGAIQGGLFVIDSENTDSREDVFELKAAIAYDRRKLLNKRFAIGEGLVGRCAYEKLPVYLEDIPKDYIFITSGLGEANPRSLLLVPAIIENRVLAIIELVSFNRFQEFQIKFIEKIGASIAATISNLKINQHTQRLLEQSKQQSEELAAQEEELRQNLEELQATQEEVGRLREIDKEKHQQMMKEIDLHHKTLVKVFDNIPSKIFLKDNDCRMLIVNKAVLEAHDAKEEDLLGKNDFDFIENKAEAQKYYDDEQEIIRSGKAKRILQKEIINDTGIYLDSIKIPFYIDYLGKTGILGIQTDVTRMVELEEKLSTLEQNLA